MIETEQLELPLAVQPSDFKQTEFPWRILCEQKESPRKRAVASSPRGVRPPRHTPVRKLKDLDCFALLGLTFPMAPPEVISAIVAETPVQTPKEKETFRLEA